MGVLDKATLRLGDNTSVHFERTLIFLTSNLGAREMQKQVHPDFGFEALTPPPSADAAPKLDRVGMGAVRRRLPPEFVNRIDAVITYQPLSAAALAQIVDQQIAILERHIENRLGERAFALKVNRAVRQFLQRQGTSSEYGARELKRVILRHLTQPLAAMVANGEIAPEAVVHAEVAGSGDQLTLTVED
jgi:ATP-dependent Clp protease ATP-binding subunit ClpA